MEIVGLTEENIKKISSIKKESDEILKGRLQSFRKFQKMDLPDFGPRIDIDFLKLFIISLGMIIVVVIGIRY